MPRRDVMLAAPPAALALVVPMFVVPACYDRVVLPRLAATLALTGLAVIVVAILAPGAWAGLPRRVWVAAALFLVAASLSTALGADPIGSLLGEFQRYQGLLVLVAGVALTLVVSIVAAAPVRAAWLSWGVVLGGAAAAAYGLLETLGLGWLDWPQPGNRAGGLFAQPNVLGTQLAVSITLAVSLLLTERGWRRDLAAGSAGLMLAVLLLTLSRGGWLAALVGLAVFFLATRPTGLRRATLAAFATVVVVVLVLVTPVGRSVSGPAAARAEAGLDVQNQATRLGLWESAVQMWRDHPWLGSGPDSFGVLFPGYREPDQPGIEGENVRPESAHSFLLDQLVDLGLIGTSARWGLVVAVAWPVFTILGRRRLDAGLAGPAAALVAYFVAVSVSYSEAMTGWIPWYILGIIVGRTAPLAAGRAKEPGHSVSLRLAAGAAGTTLALGAGWLLVADWYSGRAAVAPTAASAASHGGTAARINPLVPGYGLRTAEYELAAGDPAAAADRFHALNRRFAPTAYSLIAEARALQAAGGPAGDIERLLRRALELDPHNLPARAAAAQVRGQARGGSP